MVDNSVANSLLLINDMVDAFQEVPKGVLSIDPEKPITIQARVFLYLQLAIFNTLSILVPRLIKSATLPMR